MKRFEISVQHESFPQIVDGVGISDYGDVLTIWDAIAGDTKKLLLRNLYVH